MPKRTRNTIRDTQPAQTQKRRTGKNPVVSNFDQVEPATMELARLMLAGRDVHLEVVDASTVLIVNGMMRKHT